MILSHYSSFERPDRVTGEIKPPTMRGGGFMPQREDNHGKAGHGFLLVAGITSDAMPLVARIVPNGTNEAKVATAMLRQEFTQSVSSRLDPTKVGVARGDAPYSAQSFRQAAHSVGYVPNTHPVSHADRERSKDHAVRKDNRTYRINGKPNWVLTGNRELKCRCSKGATKKGAKRLADGSARASLAGWCKSCGNVNLVTGEWRKAQKKDLLVKVMPGEERFADWSIGNPLTFNDPLATKGVS